MPDDPHGTEVNVLVFLCVALVVAITVLAGVERRADAARPAGPVEAPRPAQGPARPAVGLVRPVRGAAVRKVGEELVRLGAELTRREAAEAAALAKARQARERRLEVEERVRALRADLDAALGVRPSDA